MKVKRYTAASMQEAIDRIRDELGPSAVILHSKRISQAGVRGIFRRPVVEVTAAVEDTDLRRHRGVQPQGAHVDIRHDAGADDDGQGAMEPSSAEEVERIAPTANRLAPGSASLAELKRTLIEHDVDAMIAEGLIKATAQELERLPDLALKRERLAQRVRACFQVAGPITVTPGARTVVALVGPTGVGKTTTVAKLASHFSIGERRNVGLVTVDLYRIGATDQLRIYADLLGTSLEVVVTPADLRRALDRFASKELVLIDTAGRSPYNWMQVLELSGFFKGIEPLDVHLVLSAATRSRESMATVKRFSALPLHKIMFTKLDESGDFGALLNVAVLSRKPISYLTMGQKVPEDIEVASAERLAELVCAESRR